jgi:hypothetical protein
MPRASDASSAPWAGAVRTAQAPRMQHDFSRVPVHGGTPASTEQRGVVAPQLVHRALAAPSMPLASAEAAWWQRRLGRSFAHVRVHSDALAADSADAVNASAYTVGSHVVFGRGHGPDSRHYIRTLAHEIAHVDQQRDAGIVKSTIPVGAQASIYEREADEAAHHLIPGRPGRRPSSAPLQLSRQPRLTIVDADSGLADKELAVIVVEAGKALDKTTQHAAGERVKAGVKITYQRGLKDVDKLVKRGDVIVYVIGAGAGKKTIPQSRMEKIVHDIVDAQKILPQRDVDKRSKMLASDLREDVNPKTGEVSGQHEYDPAASVSIVNVDLNPKRDKGNLRAIAGDILHEGPGHRAFQRGYHNPKDKGVMSKNIRPSATEEDILFQGDEWDKVNEFLQQTVDDPGWNK